MSRSTTGRLNIKIKEIGREVLSLLFFRQNELSLQLLFADELQKRVLEYHVKNKKNEKTSFRRLYGVWATLYGMPDSRQHR